MTKVTRKRLLLLVLSLVCAVAVSESALALFLPQKTINQVWMTAPAMFRSSDILPYELKPNYRGRYVKPEFVTPVEINSQGYRGEEFDVAKSGRFRILAIGDSFTFGYTGPAAESYPSLLQQNLGNALDDDSIEVINAGFAAGYFPDTYYLYLKERGLKLAPDLILIGFFIGNDIDWGEKGASTKWVRIDDKGLPLQIESEIAHVENGCWVARTRAPRYRIPFVRNSHVAQACVAGVKFFFRPRLSSYFNLYIYRKNYLDRTNKAVQLVQSMFVAMSDLAKTRQIPLVVVMIPTREQVYPSEYPFDEYPCEEGYDLEKPQTIFARFFDEQGIAYLDLLPRLREEPADQSLYYEKDMHWNRKGNEVASKAIAEHLLKSRLIEVGTQAGKSREK
ncbi:MAG: hypothetical protein ABII12_14740 [Planctomycetota bacterium]